MSKTSSLPPLDNDAERLSFLKALNRHEEITLSDWDANFLNSCLKWNCASSGFTEKMQNQIERLYQLYGLKV